MIQTILKKRILKLEIQAGPLNLLDGLQQQKVKRRRLFLFEM